MLLLLTITLISVSFSFLFYNLHVEYISRKFQFFLFIEISSMNYDAAYILILISYLGIMKNIFSVTFLQKT